jgi:hypothetical protein
MNTNWLKAFDAGHAALRGIWASLHSLYSQWHKRCQLSTEDTKTAMVALEFCTNEDYNQRLNVKRETVLSEITRRTRTTDDSLFLPLLSKTVPSSELQKQNQKVKAKTRGEPGPVDRAMIPEGTADVDTENVTVLVTKRALSVFCSIYPDTIQERAAEVDRDKFVSNMKDAGFCSKNGGSSMVIFE